MYSMLAMRGSLLLDRRRRLGGDVVDHPVNPLDLVDDSVRDTGQEIIRKASPIGSPQHLPVAQPQRL